MRAVERRAFERFRAAGWAERWYVTVRRALAPFEAVADAVPRGGMVLDIGCGVGYFALRLALADATQRVVGADWDVRRIETARRVAKGVPNLLFEVADAADSVWWRRFLPESIRAIVCLDVLYLLPYDQQRALLAEVGRVLEPGGVLVVKRASRLPSWKRWWHQWQEHLAVHLLRFTKGKGLWFEGSDDSLDRLIGWGRQTFDLSHGYVYPHELVVLRKPRLEQQHAGMLPETSTIRGTAVP